MPVVDEEAARAETATDGLDPSPRDQTAPPAPPVGPFDTPGSTLLNDATWLHHRTYIPNWARRPGGTPGTIMLPECPRGLAIRELRSR
jgi:hypothetical protein